MNVIKNLKFFRVSAVQMNRRNYGLAFYLDRGALNEELKNNPPTENDNEVQTVETENGFEEVQFVKGTFSQSQFPFGSETVLIGNMVKELASRERTGWNGEKIDLPSQARTILQGFGKSTLTVQSRYDQDGFLVQIFVGTKRAFMKGVVNRHAWTPSSNEELVVIQQSWPELFKHFFIIPTVI